jgi:hypothetical protein
MQAIAWVLGAALIVLTLIYAAIFTAMAVAKLRQTFAPIKAVDFVSRSLPVPRGRASDATLIASFVQITVATSPVFAESAMRTVPRHAKSRLQRISLLGTSLAINKSEAPPPPHQRVNRL